MMGAAFAELNATRAAERANRDAVFEIGMMILRMIDFDRVAQPCGCGVCWDSSCGLDLSVCPALGPSGVSFALGEWGWGYGVEAESGAKHG